MFGHLLVLAGPSGNCWSRVFCDTSHIPQLSFQPPPPEQRLSPTHRPPPYRLPSQCQTTNPACQQPGSGHTRHSPPPASRKRANTGASEKSPKRPKPNVDDHEAELNKTKGGRDGKKGGEKDKKKGQKGKKPRWATNQRHPPPPLLTHSLGKQAPWRQTRMWLPVRLRRPWSTYPLLNFVYLITI